MTNAKKHDIDVQKSSIDNAIKNSHISVPRDFKENTDKREIFKTSLQKVADYLGVSPFNVSRDKYWEICKKNNWDYIVNINYAFNRTYAQVREELFANNEDVSYFESGKKHKDDLKAKFKRGLEAVAKHLGKNVYDVSSSEYREVIHETDVPSVTTSMLGGYAEARDEIFDNKEETPKNKKTEKEKYEDELQNKIVDELKEYIEKKGTVPTLKEFKRVCKTNVGKRFNSIREIEVLLYKKYPDTKKLTFNETSITSEYKEDLKRDIKKYNTFVITTAVAGKKVNEKFLNSIKNYAKRNQAKVLILPCEDVVNRRKEYKWELDPQLQDFSVVFDDIYLNQNFCISTIKTSAKQIQPLTGLRRLTQKKDASIVLASTKQFLEFVPNRIDEVPKALMTTGAITESDYNTDFYMSKRLSVIAENDHQLGAIVVEVADNHIFHFRQLPASENGSIVDLGTEYLPDGKIHKLLDTVMVFGDSHVGQHDEKLFKELMKFVKRNNISEVILHDIMNSATISHHDIGKIAVKVAKFQKGCSTLEQEGELVKKYLEDLSKKVNKITVVKSNHDRHLDRYLTEGRFINDPLNFYISLDLCKKLIEGEDPLKYLLEDKLDMKCNNINWLKDDESYIKYGVELGLHGDSGANGSRGSAKVFEEGIGRCITAHKHGAFITRDVYGVGTTGKLKMDYNRGMSSWTQTCCLLYENGCRQLINFIPTKAGLDYTI